MAYGKPKGGTSNNGGAAGCHKGHKAPSVNAVGPRADKFHTNGSKGK